jgi:hypothetical protein
LFGLDWLFSVGLLTALTAIQFRGEPGTVPREAHQEVLPHFGRLGLQLDLEIALGVVPAKAQLPNSIGAAEDALKRRVT